MIFKMTFTWAWNILDMALQWPSNNFGMNLKWTWRSQTKNKTKLNQSEFTYSLLFKNDVLLYRYKSGYECTGLIVRAEYSDKLRHGDKWWQIVTDGDKWWQIYLFKELVTNGDKWWQMVTNGDTWWQQGFRFGLNPPFWNPKGFRVWFQPSPKI